MDAAALRMRIQSTLDPNAEVRGRAEIDLKYAEGRPGFPNALLNLLETEQDHHIRLSAVLVLKNRIVRGWSPEDSPYSPIPEDEKEGVRNRLIPFIASSTPQIRNQLIPILTKILHFDFPTKWPNFLDVTLQLLNTNEANSVFTGLLCLLTICKVYRFKSTETRKDFDKVVALSFPQLLSIGTKLVEETSNDAGEMLKMVMKSYKQATYFDLSPHLREQGANVGWCSLFLQIVAKEAPPDALPEDLDDREQNHWWKAKKWAYSNLNRLFVRYGNPGTLQKSEGQDYTEFSKGFITNFAPEILKAYLQQIEKWVAKTTWLSKPCLSFTLVFLDECVKPKSMWIHLKPHMDNLVSHFIFPILCLSDEDLELFETDPSEYLHRKLNIYEEVSFPDVAASNFLITLTKSRKKQTFTVLNFVTGIVSKYELTPEEQRLPREKEGALRMISTLSSVILAKKSPIADEVEYFFVRHVFPEFRSPHGYLRARACDTLEKFEQLNFKDPNNLIIIYRNILESMADPELPVRVEAALALQPLIRHDIIRTAMQQNIPQIMQQLLKLANEVDVDALTNVMEEFVEVFAVELTPFAVALTVQLKDTYLRIVRELVERLPEKGEDSYGEYVDDKSITALGVLQTIGTFILTLESTPDVLAHLETILLPVIQVTLENKLYDLYNEVFEIIDSCTFSAKAISPAMWQAFELIHRTFKNGAELYLEDMLPALDKFVAYGAETLAQTPGYLAAIISMVQDIFHDDKVGGVDRICGCKLAEAVMLNLRGRVDEHIASFIELGMTALINEELKVKSYRIHLMEMIINAVYYDPILALQVLESRGWTNKFFSLWFSNIDNFSRVHDKKLSIAAIVGLLTLRADQVPISVQQGWPRLLTGAVRLFQTLPSALKNREEATKEEYNPGEDYADDEDADEWEGEDSWNEGDEVDEDDVKDESSSYLEFLNEEAQKFRPSSGEDEDEELEEESLLETPLDKVEPYTIFRDVLLRLQQQQPAMYADLTKNLNADEQTIVQGVVHQAEAHAVAAANAQAQLAQAQAQGLPQTSAPTGPVGAGVQ